MRQFSTELKTPIITTKQDCFINFKTVVTQAVDETLSSLSQDVKNAFYLNLEKKFGLKKEEIFLNIELLTKAIKSVFSESSILIEIRIIRNLHLKVKTLKYITNKAEFSFLDYMAALQNSVDCQNIVV